MRLRSRGKPTSSEHAAGPDAAPRPEGRPALVGRLRRAELEIDALRRRMAELEKEVQEARHLNKRLAEIADVVAEVLLPVQDRDDERLREVLSRYDSTL